MRIQLMLVLPAIATLAACGGGGAGVGTTPMVKDGTDGATFAQVLAAQDDVDSFVFGNITSIDDLPPGSATYEGVATVRTDTNRTDEVVTFIALGVMSADVDFAGNSMTAMASDFYELDADLFNSTAQARALDRIDGEITVVSGVGSEQELADLLGGTQEVALGRGAASGSVTQLNGTVLDLSGLSAVTFLDSQDQEAELIRVSSSDEFGNPPLDEPFTSFTMTGLR